MRDEHADFLTAQTFVGREYVAGEYDCAHLFVEVQRTVFGVATPLPDRFALHAQGRAGQAAQIAHARDELAVKLAEPEHGCGVLITGHTDTGMLWHIGTVFMFQGSAWVLHNSRVSGGASLNLLRDFAWRGQRIEGFYKWKQ